MIYQQWIRDNAEALIEEVLNEIAGDPKLDHYRKRMPAAVMQERIRNVFYDGFERLEKWLERDPEDDAIIQPYIELGRERQREGVPMDEVIHVFMLVNRTINRQIEANKLFDTRYKLNELSELNRKTSTFFSKIVHAIIRGYEEGYKRQP